MFFFFNKNLNPTLFFLSCVVFIFSISMLLPEARSNSHCCPMSDRCERTNHSARFKRSASEPISAALATTCRVEARTSTSTSSPPLSRTKRRKYANTRSVSTATYCARRFGVSTRCALSLFAALSARGLC